MSADQNLFSVFQQSFPEDLQTAFITTEAGDTVSYGDMLKQSAQLANYFVSLGLKKGDRIAVQVDKSPFALMTYLAALRAGLIYLPLNTGYRLAELEYFFNDAEPSLVLCREGDQNALQPLLPDGIPIETLTATGEGSLAEKSKTVTTEFETVPCEGDELAAILYTSGTTGRPKGAMLSHKNLASNALVLKELWGFTADDVLLHALPIFHVHGLFVGCHCVLASGASMIFLPSFDVEKIEQRLPQSTVMMGVPTFYTRLLADENFTADMCSNMRLFISGSAPMLAETHHQFHNRIGQWILERYGMTETGMLVSNPLEGERRAGMVGFPLPGVDVQVVDGNNIPVAIDEVGSIQVKGDNVFQGYWQMPEKTAEEFTDDGYFITGDQGKVSEDGYISIVGRAKDMIITGGYNVYPKEVEQVLDDLAGIKETAVIGVPDTDFGEAVVAVIVGDGSEELKADSIIQQTKQQLASYKVPKTIHFVEELPRNTMGKVQKQLLREEYK